MPGPHTAAGEVHRQDSARFKDLVNSRQYSRLNEQDRSPRGLPLVAPSRSSMYLQYDIKTHVREKLPLGGNCDFGLFRPFTCTKCVPAYQLCAPLFITLYRKGRTLYKRASLNIKYLKECTL